MSTIGKTLLRVAAVCALAAGLTACGGPGRANDAAERPITDVELSDWENPMYPGTYAWKYASPGADRICSMYPPRSGAPAGISCAAEFPADAPEVANDVFTGPPNTVVLTDEGVRISIDEGGPFTPELLAPDHRITMDDLSCTTLPGNGISCESPAAGFTAKDGRVTQTGTTIAPSTPASSAPSSASPSPTAGVDGHYTDGTDPVAAGTMCGVAIGNTPVQVISGRISCTDAIAVIDGYLNAPDDGSHGNTKTMKYRGYSCTAPTAVAAQELGYGAKCTRGDIELIMPTF